MGALVDLGIDPDRLTNELDKLKLDEFTIDFKKVTKHSIAATHAVVEECNPDQKQHNNHHHDPASASNQHRWWEWDVTGDNTDTRKWWVPSSSI